MERGITKYTSTDLTTNTSFLDEEQKGLIATSLSQHWTIPEFKVTNFIGNAQITPYAKLKQYLLELNTREGSVELMEYEVQKIGIEIEIQNNMAIFMPSCYKHESTELKMENKKQFNGYGN